MTADECLLTHTELIAHIKWLHQNDERDDVGQIRLHKNAYFSFGYYLLMVDNERQKEHGVALLSTPFPNNFYNGDWGAFLDGFQSSEQIKDIEAKEWQPTTLNGMLFYGIQLDIKKALDDLGDVELIELTQDGSVFKHYNKLSPRLAVLIASERILTEMQERFASD